MNNRFQGFPIKQDEDGFYWQEGGYFDTIEECRADIADWNAGELAREIAEGLHPDTPSLEAPWWSAR